MALEREAAKCRAPMNRSNSASMPALNLLFRTLGWVLWLGPVGFVGVILFSDAFRACCGGDAGQDVLRLILALLIASYPAMLLHLFVVSKEPWDTQRSWLVWLFFGGPFVACYYLCTRH